MITHVVVELEFPVEEEYWTQEDYADEYYGIGRPLIMCKDCKYWGADGYRYGCKYAVQIMTEDNFCSRAERKEE